MTEDQQQRLGRLEECGWKLVSAPSVDESHDRSRVTAPFTLVKLWRGGELREPGHTLDQALEVAEWQENRIAGLENEPVTIIENIAGTSDF